MHESNIPDNSLPDFAGSIEINNQQLRQVPLERIRSIIGRILADWSLTQGEISVAIVDDRLMQQLNRKYLEHDYPTDVLSFVLDHDIQKQLLSGEIIVSADTADAVAVDLGHSMDDELLLYVIHGMLHLVGLNDKTPDDQSTMMANEATYLESLGIKNLNRVPSTERTQP